MQKGKDFEDNIKALIKDLNALGIHGHKNNPLRVMNGAVIEGEPFDFEIFLPHAVHVFDTKECATPTCRWHIGQFTGSNQNNRRLQAQTERLLQCGANTYCRAYFLVHFIQATGNHKYIMFTPQTVLTAIEEGRKFLTWKDGAEWSIPAELEHIQKAGGIRKADITKWKA